MNNLKLNPKLFDNDVEQAPIRFGYGDGLLQAGKEAKQGATMLNELRTLGGKIRGEHE